MLVPDLDWEPCADKILRENWDPWNGHLPLPEYAQAAWAVLIPHGGPPNSRLARDQ